MHRRAASSNEVEPHGQGPTRRERVSDQDPSYRLPKIEGRTFAPGEEVRLDGYAYAHCTFNKCVLAYAGGLGAMTHCTIIDCQFRLDGPAGNAIAFLATMYRGTPIMQKHIEDLFDGIRQGRFPGTWRNT